MTRLWNDPSAFVDEMVDGFVRANRRWVRKVAGGVARSTRSAEPEVAVIIGGGAGHYPAFAGFVGPGFAHGAVIGNLFASPSAHQVESVIRASEQGRGVLLSYGNYAGDVLNFTAAQDAVRAEGIDCRSVTVTDDVFSANPDEDEQRRGIAGDLTVFRVAGAAAAAGYDIDEVERVASKTNARTRSLGVAFTGCTLPGGEEPLFTVPQGRMAIGLGIHGEPGIDEADVPNADGLAALFVERLLDTAEVPAGVNLANARVIPILNGLGSVKYEELYVVFGRVATLLEHAGITLVDPQVGEFCTSFDMAGVSLTLFWVDEELEELWSAPVGSAAFRSDAVDASAFEAVEEQVGIQANVDAALPESSEESRQGATQIAAMLDVVRELLDEKAEELGRLDSVAGDGDHGIGMQRGARAAAETARAVVTRGAGARSVLMLAGEAWVDKGGGTSGALWGVILQTLGTYLSGSEGVRAASVAAGVTAAAAAVMEYGGARPGDKTLVDALVPFADAIGKHVGAGDSLAAAWEEEAAADAQTAAPSSADLIPRKGRARSHGAKALGAADPGAVSFAMIVVIVRDVLARE